MPPSIYDTHCSGAGLLPTTLEWPSWYKVYRRYCADIHTTLPMPVPRSSPGHDLRGKTAIVSGANSGIGKAAALHFALCGATVVLACRLTASHEQPPDQTRDEILAATDGDAESVQVWEVDCSSLASVRRFGERWRESGRRCDILVNNAGLSAGGRVITEEGFELTHAVNFLSHTLLTFYILPSMRTAAAPRIINTCSSFHAGGTLDFANFNNEKHTPGGPSGVQWYCDTKLRLLMWTVELQHRLSRSDAYRHVVAHGVHPGFVGSNIWERPGSTLGRVPRAALRAAVARWSISPTQGAWVLVHAACSPALGLPGGEEGKLDAEAEAEADGKATRQPSHGLSAAFGGKYVNRDRVDLRRPKCEDVLARSRLWQRTLEDTRAEELGLTEGIPGHLEELLTFK